MSNEVAKYQLWVRNEADKEKSGNHWRLELTSSFLDEIYESRLGIEVAYNDVETFITKRVIPEVTEAS